MCRQTLSSSYGSISFLNASFRAWALQTHPACDAFNRNPQCRRIVCRKTEREKKKIKVTASLAQEFGLNASWMLSVLFWELSHTRTHITSRMAAHSTSFTINSLVALKCYFIKLLWKEKIKFFWSDYFLRWDYLWRGLSHLTVTGSCACTGQQTFFLCYFQPTFSSLILGL